MMKVWLIVGTGIVALAAMLLWLSGERPGALAREENQIRLTHLLIILVLVGSGLVVRWRDRPKLKWLQHGLIWTGLGLALVVGYSYRADIDSLWSRTLAELMPGRAIEIATGTVIVRAGEDRHFLIDFWRDGVSCNETLNIHNTYYFKFVT